MKTKILSLFAAGAALLGTVQADNRFYDYYNPEPSNYIGSDEWWQGNTFLGDWWGTRNWLSEEIGIEFSLSYTTNLAGNPVGGMRQGFTYTDNIGFGVKFDLEKIIGWRGAALTVSALDRNGTSLSQHYIGNQFTVQQVYGGQTLIFYGLFLTQKFWDDKAELKVGRYATGDDFASSPLYWLYMNNGIDGNPQALPVNGQFSAYPWAVWAARLRIDPSPEWNAMLGLYQVSDRTFQPYYHGVNMGFEANDGMMIIGQIGWTPEFYKRPVPAGTVESGGQAAIAPSKGRPRFSSDTPSKNTATDMKGLPGHYWFGGYYSTWEYPQFAGSTAPNAYGFYWHADQMVYQEAPGSNEGLTLWTAFVSCPQQNISKVPFQWNAGVVYQGLIPTRDNDMTLFGIAWGNFSSDYSDSGGAYQGLPASYECVLEWGYRIQLSKFFYIQPDMQYVIRPGGTGAIPNALVLGAQIGMIF